MKLTLNATHQKTQTGFALIPLIILSLFGIAAGVLLVQNGVNFLPKAVEPPSRNTQYCDRNNPNSCPPGQTCAVLSGVGKCVTPTTSDYCTLVGIRNPGSDTDILMKKNQLWEGCDTAQNKVRYLCNGNNNLSVEILQKSSSECGATTPAAPVQAAPAAAAPAAQSASQPASEAGGCTKEQADSCNGRCYKDSSGTKRCTPSKENLSGCDEAQQKQCTDKKRANGCMIIRGEVKCLYSKDATCDTDDSNSCPHGCAVVQREGYWVSECKETVCSQGYQNFCMVTKNKSCEIEKSTGVPDCTGDPSKAPIQPTTGAPAAPGSASRPATGGPVTTGTQPAANSGPVVAQQAQPVADLICGKDEKGIDIPCYAIGVFSPSELSTREAQAQLASINYAKFRKIIDDEEKRVGEEVASKAKEKIAAAEKEIKACLERK